MIATEADAGRLAHELQLLEELLRNTEWLKIQSIFTTAHAYHLDALSDRASSIEKRSEHLEAYHLAKESAERVPHRIAALKAEITAFRMRTPHGVLASEHEGEI